MLEEKNTEIAGERIPYVAPAIVYEATLEVTAGSPLGLPDPLDLTGTSGN